MVNKAVVAGSTAIANLFRHDMVSLPQNSSGLRFRNTVFDFADSG
jgi:hypothetical protein